MSPVRSQPSWVSASAGRGVVVPVAAEDGRPGEEDLAVLGDPHANAGERLADGADLVAAGRFTVAAAVVSVSPYPSRMVTPTPRKKWPSRSPSGGAAGHRVAHPAAHRGAQLAVDQPVEERVLAAAAPGRARRPSRRAAVARRRSSAARVEDRALAARVLGLAARRR